MRKKHVLVQWIGHSDFRAMALSLPTADRDGILTKLGGEPPMAGDRGPTKTLLDTQSFDEVRLLSTYPSDWNKRFLEWLGHQVDVVTSLLDKPTDYESFFRIAERELAAIRERKDWATIDLCLHLSPGTPAMTAIWLLLGKTRYPATFFETFRGSSWETEIPFDITIDVVPDLLRDPDAQLQHLASESPSEIEGFEDIVGDSKGVSI